MAPFHTACTCRDVQKNVVTKNLARKAPSNLSPPLRGVLFAIGETGPRHPGHATRASAVAGGLAAQRLPIFFCLLRPRALFGLFLGGAGLIVAMHPNDEYSERLNARQGTHTVQHPGQAHSLAWADKGALVQAVCATTAHAAYATLTADACVLACRGAASAGVACRRP